MCDKSWDEHMGALIHVTTGRVKKEVAIATTMILQFFEKLIGLVTSVIDYKDCFKKLLNTNV